MGSVCCCFDSTGAHSSNRKLRTLSLSVSRRPFLSLVDGYPPFPGEIEAFSILILNSSYEFQSSKNWTLLIFGCHSSHPAVRTPLHSQTFLHIHRLRVRCFSTGLKPFEYVFHVSCIPSLVEHRTSSSMASSLNCTVLEQNDHYKHVLL